MVAYYMCSHQSVLPIFTMTMPGTKMYVVTTPELIQAIQKQPKELAFPPIEAKFASRVCGSSAEAHKIMMTNVNGDEGDWGLSMETYAAMRAALAPGPDLDNMNRVMIQNIAAALDHLTAAGGKHAKIGLAKWLRSSVTAATTNSVYGPQNPFKQQAVEDGFWYILRQTLAEKYKTLIKSSRDFESDLVAILIGVLPSITARKGVAGRAKVTQAFERYFRTGGHKESSILMQNRYETGAKNGLSIEDIARFEVGGAIAILVNTAPAAFWTLLYVYSHPGILEDIRKEVSSIMTTTVDETGNPIWNLDITNVKTKCPILTSTFQEVLRHRSMGTSIRQVMQDTFLKDQWLLKKGCMIQMPGRVIHKDPSIWGSDVDEFNPRRFMKGEVPKTENGKPPNPAAFRAFGGGTTLCPGRHFATTEILAVVTMFVMRYNMEPTAGAWSLPKTDNTNVAAVVMEPDSDVEVEVSMREGFEGGQWTFSLRNSGMIFAVVAEDI